jgi:2-methylcitrate dehydratase PrpD
MAAGTEIVRSPTKHLANYGAALTFGDIPTEVIQRVKNTIADIVGAIVYGHCVPWGRIVCEYVEAVGREGSSHILGSGGRTSPAPLAALANGVLAHSFELDGATKPSVGVHPAATIFPAALAVAQERRRTGRDLITSFVAASEIMIRVGRATKKTNERRGFHAPGTTGPFGAAMAASLLAGADPQTITNALGIAGSLAGGLIQFSQSETGGMVKSLHIGRAGESGVLAARLAERGFTGPNDVLEGKLGFLHAFCDEFDTAELTRGLGEEFCSISIQMKRFPAHGMAQSVLQCLEELQHQYNFAGDDIDTITVAGSATMVDRHDIVNPGGLTHALYSVPFSVALACYRNPRDPRSFDEAALNDSRIQSLCSRIRLVRMDDAAPFSTDSCEIMVQLKNGPTLRMRRDDFTGTPTSPPSQADVREKFDILTRHCHPARAREVFDRIQGLESEGDLQWLSL